MSEKKLMYIWDNKELPADRERAERRVAMVQKIGFRVVMVANRQQDLPERLLELEDEARECVGLWMDLPANDARANTTQLVAAAYDAGVKLLGCVPKDERVARSLETFIGVPARAEVVQR